eukprot:6965091-Pyramimonas_sp.AAC.2
MDITKFLLQPSRLRLLTAGTSSDGAGPSNKTTDSTPDHLKKARCDTTPWQRLVNLRRGPRPRTPSAAYITIGADTNK